MVTVTELNRAPDGRFESLEAKTLIGADVANASENQILVVQGDGTLAAETQAEGPNPYDQAQSFEETDVSVTTTNTAVKNGSIQLSGFTGFQTVDDFESGDLVVEEPDWNDWSGDISDFVAQQSTVISGSWSGEISGSLTEVKTIRNDAIKIPRFDFKVQIEGQTGSGEEDRFNLDQTGGAFARISFVQDGSIVDDSGVTSETWTAGTTYQISIRNIDYTNETYDFYLDGSEVNANVGFRKSATGLDGFRLNHANTSGGTWNTYVDDVDSFEEPPTSGEAIIEWDRGIPTDIFEWDVATFTQTLDGETVDVFVAYSSDGGSTWARTNSGNPISRSYSLRDDSNITSDVDVRIETELSSADTANNPSLDSAYRSWLV